MAAPDANAPLTLWLTDRTRVEDGLGRCARKRYLGFHAGATGYGLAPRRESLPLATGLTIHEGFALFLAILKAGRLPSLPETRAIVAEVIASYVKRVEARGFLGILGSATTEETIYEQATLITGLLWALRLKFLEWFHTHYQVVAIEEERLHFLSCTCGAPPRDTAEHLRRGCSGRALMIRTDLLAQRRGGTGLAYFETKTTSWDSDAWAEQWETKPQLALGTLDAEAIWGAEVSEIYIVGLGKGSRKKDKYDDDGKKRQLSPLCYGYAKPANPPLMAEDWLPSYQWVDANGEVKRKSKLHRRKGVWEMATSDWPTWIAYRDQDPDLSPAEFWVRWLPPSLLEKTVFLLGPMNRQDVQLQSTVRAMDAEEERWQHALWELYELQMQGHDWASPTFQAALDRLIPQSWQCRPFGKDHECPFKPICYREEGWQDPLGSGRYQPRLPHHEPELQQAIARGLLPEEATEVDEEER